MAPAALLLRMLQFAKNFPTLANNRSWKLQSQFNCFPFQYFAIHLLLLMLQVAWSFLILLLLSSYTVTDFKFSNCTVDHLLVATNFSIACKAIYSFYCSSNDLTGSSLYYANSINCINGVLEHVCTMKGLQDFFPLVYVDSQSSCTTEGLSWDSNWRYRPWRQQNN